MHHLRGTCRRATASIRRPCATAAMKGMMNMHSKSHVISVDDSDNTITFTPKECHASSLIFMHGLGDTAFGWADTIHDIIQSQKMLSHVKCILPTAPTQPVTLNRGMSMPSWYDIQSLSDRAEDTCDGIDASRARIVKLIEHEVSMGISTSRIVLGGFSQVYIYIYIYAGTWQDVPNDIWTERMQLARSLFKCTGNNLRLVSQIVINFVIGRAKVTASRKRWNEAKRGQEDWKPTILPFISSRMEKLYPFTIDLWVLCAEMTPQRVVFFLSVALQLLYVMKYQQFLTHTYYYAGEYVVNDKISEEYHIGGCYGNTHRLSNENCIGGYRRAFWLRSTDPGLAVAYSHTYRYYFVNQRFG